jgi:hypothetical protein
MWLHALSCKCIVFIWKWNGNFISQRFRRESASSCSLLWRIPLWCCGYIFFQRCLKPVARTYIIVQFFLISLLFFFWLKYFLLRKAPFSVMSHQDVAIKIYIRCWFENPVPIFSDLSSYDTALAVGGRHSTGHILLCHATGMWVLLMQEKFRWLSNQQHTQNVYNTEHSSLSSCKYGLVDCDATIRES